MKKILTLVTILLAILDSNAQIDTTLLKRTPSDTGTARNLNMDAVYNRPFLQFSKIPVSLGGYVEAGYQYMGTDGITDGHSFSLPRMTIFLASTIHPKIRFLSEIELEEGGREINIEFAALDFVFHPLLNLRGGVIMNPIGAFNQNHDGPKWEFVDRPVAMTQMLPATWSNIGFGLYGKYYKKDWAFGYECYLSNGFDDRIIGNGEGKTFLPASKENIERFTESSNGQPMLTFKIAASNTYTGEAGISYMGGVYNTFKDDGLIVDDKRRADVLALDYNITLPSVGTYLVAEWAWVWVQVPGTYIQQFGDRQNGGFIDIVQPVLKKRMLGFERAAWYVSVRAEYVDWNKGTFLETGDNIAEDLWGFVPSISFRPTSQTVFRLNYRYMQQRDLLGNPAAITSGIQFGVSSYF
jgi:hypothetical protein